MTLTARDRKILLAVAPLVVLIAYWFLLLSPKREEAAKAGEELAQAQAARDQAQGQATQLERAKATFASDYTAMVRLGKAVPTKLDLPSLIVQLDSAARGTGIRFQKVAAGEDRTSGAQPSAPAASGAGSGGDAQAGGASQSGPGSSAEQANGAKAGGDKQAGQRSGVDATTSTPTKKGGVPVGGAAGGSSGGASAAGACPPGLECVPLEFEFEGGFFDLADFFHKLKRFVHVAGDRLAVGGRLMTIDSFKFSTDQDSFPKLKSEVTATVYLSPKQKGPAAGASAQGPPASSPTAPTGEGAPPSGAPPSPAATATR